MKTNKDGSTITIPVANGRPGERAAWLLGNRAVCATLPLPPKEVRRLVLLGAPGVGKGSQAELLHLWCGACHLSTGDIFRAAKGLPPGERTPALESALGCMARGELVPDETVIAMVRERLRCLRCAAGFLLDGFPRTVAQAEVLERLLKADDLPLDAVLDYELDTDQIVERLAGRRVCASCKDVFNVKDKRAAAGICPHCGGQLYQREDDRPAAIRVRMETYHRNTAPLIQYYRQRGLLLTIPADGTPAEILERSVAALDAHPHPRSANPNGSASRAG